MLSRFNESQKVWFAVIFASMMTRVMNDLLFETNSLRDFLMHGSLALVFFGFSLLLSWYLGKWVVWKPRKGFNA